MISACSAPIYTPLRSWVVRIQSHNLSSHATEDSTALHTQDWAQQSAAQELDEAFRLACHRDLNANVLRLRLYLEDDRTVGVLLQHVQDRITDEYSAFRDAAVSMYAESMRDTLLSSTALRALLKSVCNEQPDS